jgi:cation transport ATPase
VDAIGAGKCIMIETADIVLVKNDPGCFAYN